MRLPTIRTHALVVGDLNSPRRSRALTQLPAGYSHAYNACGTGISYTWPVPFPVYAIDHCIHGPYVIPIKYSLESTTLSDHRQQIFDFEFDKPKHATGEPADPPE